MLQSMRSAAKWIWLIIAIVFIGGFVFYQSSGLFNRSAVTTSTPIATVNGQDILYTTWANARENAVREQEQRTGRTLTLEERDRVGDEVYDQLVTDVLLQQEYAKRGIAVSDDDIREAAQYSPPPQLMQSPELQTEGQFDPEKYQRFLRSPVAKQGGLLLQLESYYRAELPRMKLFQQIATDAYVSEARLWQMWKDARDSAQISYVAFRPTDVPDQQVTVTDAEVRAYFEKHKNDIEQRGRAVVSVIEIPRAVTAADSAAVRARAVALRNEILGGAKFEDVAKRESADSASAVNGGQLPRGPRGRFVAQFEQAAYALKPGQISEPVLSPFGYHLIRVDERKGDTLALRHVLLKIAQSDSTATVTDRKADQLARLAASSDDAKKFDAAAKEMGLPVLHGVATEGQPLTLDGRFVPNVSAWAFSGVRVGETSELLDSDDGYYLARLDSIVPGGKPSLEQATPAIREEIAHEKKLDALIPQARAISAAVAVGQSLEQAAQGKNLPVQKTPAFTRLSTVPGVGSLNEVIGAAFGLPVGAVSAPIKATGGVYVIRVDRRAETARAAFDAQKTAQREQILQTLRQQRVRDYLDGLKKSARITDRRKEVNAAARQTAG